MNPSRLKNTRHTGLLTILVLGLFMFMSFSVAFAYNLQLEQESFRIQREARELDRELDRLLAEEAEMRHRLPALNNAAFVEETARKQLDMVFEGDRIFIESLE